MRVIALVSLIVAFACIPVHPQVLGRAQHVPTDYTTPCAGCEWNTTNSETDAFCYLPTGTHNGLTFTATASGFLTSATTEPSGTQCPTALGHAIADHKGALPTSAPDTAVDCARLQLRIRDLEGANAWQLAYDSGKYYIQHCYDDPMAPLMFTTLQGAVQALASSDTGLWIEYRAWLESVLYLNTTNPDYFCQCLEAIGGTYHSFGDTSLTQFWQEQNRGLAITRWLLQNTDCDTALLRHMYDGTRKSQLEGWHNDTTVKYDTTLPSMHDLGLDTLLARHFLYSVSERRVPNIFASVVASPNPADAGTVITFGLSKEAYVKIELFDVIGHRVEIPPMESLFEAGNHAITLSLHGLPSATYYARLVTAYGEAQTVKIVKE